ncbi:DUF2059 domain-containing protein [Shewanella cyperi]|uniref:DUF2059 domain-containing protein n=1 Tax=Shewanella cyperi TaxID=2814292 RepID=A0A975ALI3_9GAMM|nr:DUF2059 domain-containing protein [Shewanella cyperi]QSX30437.1 DUF2059 domain-containing protein [Shewanella cyperi]QSX41209.1 DUF2059 domain-containing protein [Shewanella cyperi]
MKKSLTALLLGASLLTLPAMAGEVDRRAQVEELLNAMKADSLMDSIYSQMDGMMQQMAAQLQVKDSEREQFTAYTQKVIQLITDEMGWNKIKGPMVDIYVNNYSEKELADMLAFYRSESGQSMVNKMPAVMQQSMQYTMGMMQQLTPKIQAMSQEFQQQLQASREQAQSSKQ